MGKPTEVEIILHYERCDNKRKLNMHWIVIETIGNL
jgi:hypothetical protein